MSRFTLVDIDDALLEGEYNTNSLFLHVTFKAPSFTKTMYLDFLEIWELTINALRQKGVSEVFSLIPKDAKTIKWQKMFGMELFLEFKTHCLFRRVL